MSRNARSGSVSLASTAVNAARFTIASGAERFHSLAHGIVITDVERGVGERVHLVVRGHLCRGTPAQAASGAGHDSFTDAAS